MNLTDENEDYNDNGRIGRSNTVVESDKEFEEQLKIFKEKLDLISKEGTKQKRKLVPNVTKGWINQLKSVLKS